MDTEGYGFFFSSTLPQLKIKSSLLALWNNHQVWQEQRDTFKCSNSVLPFQFIVQHHTNYKSRKPCFGFPKHTLFFAFCKLLRSRIYLTNSPNPCKYHHMWINSAPITFSLSTYISNKSRNHHPQSCAIWRITVLYNIHHLMVTHTNTSVFYNRSHSRVIANMSTHVWEPEHNASGPSQRVYLHRWLALGTRKLFGQASLHPHQLLQHKMSRSDLHGSHYDRQWYPLQRIPDIL